MQTKNMQAKPPHDHYRRIRGAWCDLEITQSSNRIRLRLYSRPWQVLETVDITRSSPLTVADYRARVEAGQYRRHGALFAAMQLLAERAERDFDERVARSASSRASGGGG